MVTISLKVNEVIELCISIMNDNNVSNGSKFVLLEILNKAKKNLKTRKNKAILQSIIFDFQKKHKLNTSTYKKVGK